MGSTREPSQGPSQMIQPDHVSQRVQPDRGLPEGCFRGRNQSSQNVDERQVSQRARQFNQLVPTEGSVGSFVFGIVAEHLQCFLQRLFCAITGPANELATQSKIVQSRVRVAPRHHQLAPSRRWAISTAKTHVQFQIPFARLDPISRKRFGSLVQFERWPRHKLDINLWHQFSSRLCFHSWARKIVAMPFAATERYSFSKARFDISSALSSSPHLATYVVDSPPYLAGNYG